MTDSTSKIIPMVTMLLISAVRRLAWGLFAAVSLGSVATSAQATTDAVLIAQIIEDASLGTNVVETQGSSSVSIDQGTVRGTNLFHSFQEFNVNVGQQVYFLDPGGIENILSRVTGNNVSEIDGLLGVNGAANLFLLNPNGIVFGSNAQLDMSSSFTASGGESFLFSDGNTFSAVNPQGAQFLTVNAPVGVQFGTSPQGNVLLNGTTLELSGADSNLELSGSNIFLDNAALRQPGGGNIILKTPQTEVSSVFLVNSTINTDVFNDSTNSDGGDIKITTHNLSLQNTAVSASTFSDENSGLVEIESSGSINLLQPGLDFSDPQAAGSTIRSSIGSSATDNTNATGNSGGVSISTNALTLQNRSEIDATNFSNRASNAGEIIIRDADMINLDGESRIGTQVGEGAMGNTSGITIVSIGSLRLRNGSFISSATLGDGTAGLLKIEDAGIIALDSGSFIESDIVAAATGNAVGILIRDVGVLELQNESSISAENLGFGNAVGILIRDVGVLELQNESSISTDTIGLGNSGLLIVSDAERVNLGGRSRITSQVNGLIATKNSEGIVISTDELNLRDESYISTGIFSNFNEGRNAAPIQIISSGRISLENSFIFSGAADFFDDNQGLANAGNISVRTGEVLLMRSGSLIEAQATTDGDGGTIDIEADFLVTKSGENNDILADGTGGDGGRINIRANDIIGFLEVEEFNPTLRINNTNDISARSESGISGEVLIETFLIDPNQGLTELPPDVVNPADQIAQSCGLNGNTAADDPTGEFTITGRGGQPLNPTDVVDSNTPLVDLGPDNIPTVKPFAIEHTSQRRTVTLAQPQLVNAQGAVVTESNEVFLVATAAWQPTVSCSSLRNSQ